MISTHQKFEDPSFLMEFGCHIVQQFVLVFTGVGPGVQDVIQDSVSVQVEPLRNGAESVWSTIQASQGMTQGV